MLNLLIGFAVMGSTVQYLLSLHLLSPISLIMWSSRSRVFSIETSSSSTSSSSSSPVCYHPVLAVRLSCSN
ncbi:hypothetical protein RB195_008733 [Necator americanus]|uniref:Secreted protein n=1 Tax=Necator americanus TaxID=51031 RepID=A0ABR1CQ30_NECAM